MTRMMAKWYLKKDYISVPGMALFMCFFFIRE